MPTLDSMSTPDDAASRLSHALDEVFSKGVPDLSRGESSQGVAEPTFELTLDAEVNTATDIAEVDIAEVDIAEVDIAKVDIAKVDIAKVDIAEPVPLPRIVPATDDHEVIEPVLPAQSRGGAVSATRTDPAAHVTQPVTAPVPSAPRPVAAPARAPATAWGDHLTPMPVSSGAQLRGPGRRPRVRRVTRVLRHIDPWSTFKVGLLFSLVGYVVMLTAGALLWRVADSTGTLANIERWFTQFGWETFELKGGEVFHNAWIIGLFGVVALTGGLVLLATLFNLVSDIVGGVRVTVLEEEVVERTVSSTRRYVVRRPPMGDAVGASRVNDWDVDGDDDGDPARSADIARSGQPSASPTTPATSTTPTTPPTTPTSGDDWSVDDD